MLPWLIAVTACSLLYLLSVGPVVGLQDRGYLPLEPVYIAYYPIKVIYRNSPEPVQKALRWYEDLFQP